MTARPCAAPGRRNPGHPPADRLRSLRRRRHGAVARRCQDQRAQGGPATAGRAALRGKVVTGDAMFTHRDVAQKILDAGGDYLLIVKDNQPELKALSTPR